MGDCFGMQTKAKAKRQKKIIMQAQRHVGRMGPEREGGSEGMDGRSQNIIFYKLTYKRQD